MLIISFGGAFSLNQKLIGKQKTGPYKYTKIIKWLFYVYFNIYSENFVKL